MKKLLSIILLVLLFSSCVKKIYVPYAVETKIPFVVNPLVSQTIVTKTAANIDYLKDKHDQELKPEFEKELLENIKIIVDTVFQEVPVLADTLKVNIDKDGVRGTIEVWQEASGELKLKFPFVVQCPTQTLLQKIWDVLPVLIVPILLLLLILLYVLKRIMP